jgi:hypothetical protein
VKLDDDIAIPSWQWWNAPEGDEAIAGIIEHLQGQILEADGDRVHDLVAMRAIYLDIACSRYDDIGYYRTKRSRYNLIQGAIDSTHAGIVASRPRPKIVTIGQDDAAQRRAELRQRWIDGEYERVGAYEKLSEMAMDGLLYGTGCLKVGHEDGRPVVDRVWCGDLWVDPQEERANRVRTLYQIHSMDRDVAMLTLPDHARELEHVPPTTTRWRDVFPDLELGSYRSRNQVTLLEAWRLPTAAKPRKVVTDRGPVMLGAGRHLIVCGPHVLVDEAWEHPTFPFVFFRWAPDPQRFWGQGMVERGAGMQADLNELCETIQKAYKVMVPQFWVDDQANIQKLTDIVGAVNRISPASGRGIGDSVLVLSPDVAPGLLAREQEIARRFHHVLGVDVLQSMAQKPAGLNSGAALQNYKDSVAGRFLPQGRRYDQSTVVLADLLFFFADKLAADGHDQTIRVYGESIGLQLVRYEDIKPQGDEIFETRVQPASALPKDAAGRMQFLYDVQALGLPLDPGWVAKMLEMPDVESLLDEINAGRDLVGNALSVCYQLDEEQPEANAYWPLLNPDGTDGLAMTMVTRRIQMALNRGTDPAIVERLMNLHGHIRGLIQEQREKAMQPPAPPMGAGAPMTDATGPAPGQMPAVPPPGPMGQPPPEMAM